MSSIPSKKLLIVSAVGGHLTDLVTLHQAYANYERVWVVNDVSPVLPEGERAYRVAHAERDWRVVLNLFEFAKIFAQEAPDLMLSTGSGIAVPAALCARLINIPVLYLEPSCAVRRLTLTGRIMKHLTPHFLVQWRPLLQHHPRARHAGSVF